MRPTINEQIIEALYREALLLADEARGAFDLRAESHYVDAPDAIRLALSIEGMKTTTRLMHVLAWLLNHRAFLSGELSEHQLRTHCSLPGDRGIDDNQLALLEPETRALIRDSQRLHDRIARLDADWRALDNDAAPPVRELQGRIAQAFAAR